MHALDSQARPWTSSAPDVLTPAEWRVLEYVRQGMPNAEIAVRLGIGVPTVKSHVSSMLAKTGAPNRGALAKWRGQPARLTGERAARGFVPPFGLWLTKGTSVAVVGKASAIGVSSVLFVASLAGAYALLND